MGNSNQTPWRQLSKTNETLEYKLERDILDIKLPKRKPILLVGPACAGKSSFINSMLSVGAKRLSRPAQSGRAHKNDSSYTLDLGMYTENRLLDGLDMMDTIGLDPDMDRGLLIGDYMLLLDGHIKSGYKFSKEPISKDNISYRENPKFEDKIHCVVFVIAITLIRYGPPACIMEKIHKLRSTAKDVDIPVVMILTKADLFNEFDKTCPIKMFQSKPVFDMVRKASELFNIEVCDIHPVINYIEEAEFKTDMNIVILSAMRRIKQSACDHIPNELTNSK